MNHYWKQEATTILTLQSFCDPVVSPHQRSVTLCSDSVPCLRHTLQDLEVAAEFSITNGVTCFLEALKKRNYVKVHFAFASA